jgi:hypothetical protein
MPCADTLSTEVLLLVHSNDFRHQDIDVSLPTQGMERNGGAISSAESSPWQPGMVQHWPEQVVVAFVDQRHAYGSSRQTSGSVQSAESGANNDYAGMF